MDWLAEYRTLWVAGLVLLGALLALKALRFALVFRLIFPRPTSVIPA